MHVEIECFKRFTMLLVRYTPHHNSDIQGVKIVNAIEQATNLKMISKIEAIVYIFKSKFPDIIVDLKPWLKNSNTEKYQDKNSIDIGLHFPKINFPCQCLSILMQVRFDDDFSKGSCKYIGVELSGFEYSCILWRFSTIGKWQFEGNFPPTIRTQQKLKRICYQIIKLFESKEENIDLCESNEEKKRIE